MSWISDLMKKYTARRTQQGPELLLSAAAAQIERAEHLSIDDTQLTQGEALIITGVKTAIQRALARPAKKIDALATLHDKELSAITTATTEIDSLDSLEHIVGKDKRSSEQSELVGDAITTVAARTEHDMLAKKIDDDAKSSSRLHLYGMPMRWKVVAYLLLFVDVAALFTLTIKVESATFDPRAWRQGIFEQATKMTAALGFAALGAGALALLAHIVGSYHHKWMHRHPEGADTSTDKRTLRLHVPPTLVAAWVSLFLLGTLAGITIYSHINHAAHGTSFEGLAQWVAVLIAVSAAVGPVLVGLVTALAPSPSVVRRNQLAAIIAKVNARHTELNAEISEHTTEAGELTAKATRVLARAEQEAQHAALPAVQTILALRARHGYAGEHHRLLPVIARGDNPSLLDMDDFARIEETVTAMVNATPHTHTNTLKTRVTYRNTPIENTNSTVNPESTDGKTSLHSIGSAATV